MVKFHTFKSEGENTGMKIERECINKTLCFTGRRPKDFGFTETVVSKNGREYLKNVQNENAYNGFVLSLSGVLEKFYQHGYTRFISGGAQGFDQLAFRSVSLAKKKHPEIQNIMYVPFRGQERQWLPFGYFGQDEYRKMLSAADEIYYVVNKELIEYKSIVGALYARNHAMVAASDKVLALYPDDDWQEHKGETCECMRYAYSKNVPIVQMKYHVENEALYMDELCSLKTCKNVNEDISYEYISK